ncbi:carbon storage regulator [Lacunimicrobium album]
MLVLTRKQSQMIQIGDNIVVKIIQTGKGSVKIGIDAPGDVRIIRGEILTGEHNLEDSAVDGELSGKSKNVDPQRPSVFSGRVAKSGVA